MLTVGYTQAPLAVPAPSWYQSSGQKNRPGSDQSAVAALAVTAGQALATFEKNEVEREVARSRDIGPTLAAIARYVDHCRNNPLDREAILRSAGVRSTRASNDAHALVSALFPADVRRTKREMVSLFAKTETAAHEQGIAPDDIGTWFNAVATVNDKEVHGFAKIREMTRRSVKCGRPHRAVTKRRGARGASDGFDSLGEPTADGALAVATVRFVSGEGWTVERILTRQEDVVDSVVDWVARHERPTLDLTATEIIEEPTALGSK